MKGHIFIKANDTMGRAAEMAPDILLHTNAKKNPNKQINSLHQSSSSCRRWAGQEIANLLRWHKSTIVLQQPRHWSHSQTKTKSFIPLF
jgi:hypothetical protein